MQNIIFCSYKEDLLPYKATEWSIWRDLKLAEDTVVPQGSVVLAPTWIKSALPYDGELRFMLAAHYP